MAPLRQVVGLSAECFADFRFLNSSLLSYLIDLVYKTRKNSFLGQHLIACQLLESSSLKNLLQKSTYFFGIRNLNYKTEVIYL